MKLTKTIIEKFEYPGKPVIIFDDEISGFAVRIGSSSKSYLVIYRNKYHVQKKYTIGKTTQCSLRFAREEARRILAKVIMGEKPQAEKIHNREAENVISELRRAVLKAGNA